jgi:oxygen-dependent protoporphyrinogen oxidase
VREIRLEFDGAAFVLRIMMARGSLVISNQLNNLFYKQCQCRAYSNSSHRNNIAIIGGGISALSLAYWLNRVNSHYNSRPGSITIIEQSNRLGGWINTHNYQGLSGDSYLFETGPRSLQFRGGLTTLQLIQQLNLQSNLVLANEATKNRYLYLNHNSIRQAFLMPNQINSTLTKFPLFGSIVRGIVKDFFSKPAATVNSSEYDESVHSFVSRRFNSAIADNLIDPLIAGIYAGDPKRLSIKNCLAILHQLEVKNGSVLRGMLFGKNKPVYSATEQELLASAWVKALRQAQIYSFEGGMEFLVNSLEQYLAGEGNVKFLTQTQVNNMKFGRDQIELALSNSNSLQQQSQAFDFVYTTTTAPQFAALLPAQHSQLSAKLGSIPYCSVYVVNLGYNSKVLQLHGFGLLAASSSNSDVLGITFDSDCFTKQNSNPNQSRLTVMIGGTRRVDLLTRSTAEITVIAIQAVKEILNIHETPDCINVSLQKNCIPQYNVGHSQQVKLINSSLQELNDREFKGVPRLNLLGASCCGVSLNDLIHNSKLAAMQYYA